MTGPRPWTNATIGTIALGASPGKLHAPPRDVLIASGWRTNRLGCVGGTKKRGKRGEDRERQKEGEGEKERERERERRRERNGEVGGTRRNPIGPAPRGYRSHRDSRPREEMKREMKKKRKRERERERERER